MSEDADTLTRSQKRIDEQGEVFTPPWLVEQMLDLVEDETWSDPDGYVLDPTCGSGNFLVSVVRRKIEAGLTPLRALWTTHGIDIMTDNVKETRRRLLEAAEDASKQTRSDLWLVAVVVSVRQGDALREDEASFKAWKKNVLEHVRDREPEKLIELAAALRMNA